MKKLFSLLIAGAWISLSGVPVLAEELPIGSKAPDFDLKGFTVAGDGSIAEQRYSLKDFADAKLVLIVFTCNHCPTAQAYEERIMQLATEYRDRGVAVVAITPNNPAALRINELGFSDLGDTYEETKIRAREAGFDFPYLWDGDEQVAARAYGAVATPHVFILDEERILRYRGRIDNNKNPAKTTRHDAREALDALLAGREPPESTRSFGCSIKWSEKKESVRAYMDKVNREKAALNPVSAEEVGALVRNDGEKLRLINVWSMWCGGCVAEFPDLIEIHRQYRHRGLELVTINMDPPDQQDKVLEFLNKQVASCRNTIYAEDDPDKLAEALDPQWSGAMPYTLLVEPGGKIIYRHTDVIHPLELKKKIVGYTGRYNY